MVLLSSRFHYATHMYHLVSLEADTRDALQHLLSQRLPAFVAAHTQTPKCSHACYNFTIEVWAVPFSLAATKGMDSFFVFIQGAV